MRGLVMLVVLASLAGCTEPPAEDDDAVPSTSTTGPTGTGSPTQTGTASPSTSTTTTTSAKRAPVTWEVEVRDNSFSPKVLDIQVGDTVRWVRVGSNPHTATADNGQFDSGDCPGPSCFGPAPLRQTFEWKSTEAVDVPYRCEVHGSMTGTISVRERYDPSPGESQ